MSNGSQGVEAPALQLRSILTGKASRRTAPGPQTQGFRPWVCSGTPFLNAQ